MNKEQRDAVQQMAKALERLMASLDYHPTSAVDALAAGRALLSDAAPQEPQGEWVMVPREPTPEMVKAAMMTLEGGWCEATPEIRECGVIAEMGISQADADAINAECGREHANFYRAMLAAAPAAQPATPDAGMVLSDEEVLALRRQLGTSHPPSTEDIRAIEREVLSRVKAVRKPLTEDARDAARLDWIARQDLDDLAFGLVQDAPHDGEYVVNAGNGPFYGRTLRAAIDAAMQGEQP